MPRLSHGPGLSCLALVIDALGGTGGIAQYNRDFFAALAAPPIFATVTILPRNPGASIGIPERMIQAPPRRGRLLYAVGAVAAAIKLRPDIVFCGHLHLAPLAAAIAGLVHARLIVQTHGIEVWPAPSRLRRLAVGVADLVLSVSRHTRAAVLAWADIPHERVIVVPNTIADRFKPGNGSALRSAWGLAGKRVLLTVARLDARERYKGHERVISAIPELLARGHDIAYVVIGKGEDRSRLIDVAMRLGVADRVRFVGFASPESLVQAYRMADLFVMLSSGEGFGLAYIEAMACGTPALGLAVGGARDALGDGELGIMLSREDDLAAAIDRLLVEAPRNSEALAEATRARFGRNAFAQRLLLALGRIPFPA